MDSNNTNTKKNDSMKDFMDKRFNMILERDKQRREIERIQLIWRNKQKRLIKIL